MEIQMNGEWECRRGKPTPHPKMESGGGCMHTWIWELQDDPRVQDSSPCIDTHVAEQVWKSSLATATSVFCLPECNHTGVTSRIWAFLLHLLQMPLPWQGCLETTITLTVKYESNFAFLCDYCKMHLFLRSLACNTLCDSLVHFLMPGWMHPFPVLTLVSLLFHHSIQGSRWTDVVKDLPDKGHPSLALAFLSDKTLIPLLDDFFCQIRPNGRN